MGMDSGTRFSFPCSRKASAPRAMEATPTTFPRRKATSCHRRHSGRVTKLFGLLLSDGAFRRCMKRLRTNLAMRNSQAAFPIQFSFHNLQAIVSPRIMRGKSPLCLSPVFGTGLTRASLGDRRESFISRTEAATLQTRVRELSKWGQITTVMQPSTGGLSPTTHMIGR